MTSCPGGRLARVRRRFLAGVGLAPKTLQRTLRFQGYLALAQAATHGGRVADLAAEVGYADHAHLGRECLRLTGQTRANCSATRSTGAAAGTITRLPTGRSWPPVLSPCYRAEDAPA